MSLQQTSEARKAHLLALRKRKEGGAGENGGTILLNRNFDPETRTLRKNIRSGAITEDTLERDVEGMAEKLIAEDEKQRAQELDIFNIAPKRPNWDLKREMEKKLVKLERRTQEAIHTLIRQRLAAQNGQTDDIMGAMKAQEQAQESDEDED